MKTLIAVLALSLVPQLASAQQLQLQRQAVMDGKNEISAQVGFQASMGGGTPSGAKLFFDYSRYLGSYVWLNFKLNPSFAVVGRTTCVDANGAIYDCGVGLDGDGNSVDVLAGIKLKFPIRRVKLVPYANVNIGGVGIYDRPANDNGGAFVVYTGGGLRWFITPHVSLGGEVDIALGAGFYGSTCNGCNDSHNEFYRAFNMGLGAEFVL